MLPWIEAILDVVYNHTKLKVASADQPFSYKGIDGHAGLPAKGSQWKCRGDVTGCQATLSLQRATTLWYGAKSPDSLRWWNEVVGVDGFRFDSNNQLCTPVISAC
jgi:glycogen operon protein